MFALFKQRPSPDQWRASARRVERACIGLSRSERRTLLQLLRRARDSTTGKDRAELRASLNAFMKQHTTPLE